VGGLLSGNFFFATEMSVGHSILVGQNKLIPPSRNTEVSALTKTGQRHFLIILSTLGITCRPL
jgi:hypothetical protein